MFRCKWLGKHTFMHVETSVFRHKIYLHRECKYCGLRKTKKF